MIITCNNCNTNFNIDSNLISDDGRLLQCSSCEHKWFFKKNVASITKDKDVTIGFDQNNSKNIEITPFNNQPKEKTDEFGGHQYDEDIKEKKEVNIDNDLSIKTNQKKKKSFKKFNIFLVTIITFVAFIILVDTFKHPIGKFVPSIELILYNLYESIKDISLFFKDLI